jgi:hypothetical protein
MAIAGAFETGIQNHCPLVFGFPIYKVAWRPIAAEAVLLGLRAAANFTGTHRRAVLFCGPAASSPVDHPTRSSRASVVWVLLIHGLKRVE